MNKGNKMLSSVIKIVSKAITVAAVANTSYDIYKKGKLAYKTYKSSKKVKAVVKSFKDKIKAK